MYSLMIDLPFRAMSDMAISIFERWTLNFE